MPHPAVVVVAYNRAGSLRRLLDSLDRAHYTAPTLLHISIDAGKNEDVLEAANTFTWRHGEKKVVYQPQNLGLREHILQCGDLTRDYGAIILLEDDLFVSPMFHQFATAALAFYRDKPEIAGISLYAQRMNFNVALPFQPLPDSADVYFSHWASSWGQAWDTKQWQGFRQWYAANDGPIPADAALPAFVTAWPATSWLKYFIQYCSQTDRYFVYPRESLTTNCGDAGVHHAANPALHQVALQRYNKEFRFCDVAASDAVYDAWFEIRSDRLRRCNDDLRDVELTVDLYGKAAKDVTTPYVLTSRRCNSPVRGYCLSFRPIETNAMTATPGDEIHLCRAGDVDWSDSPEKRLWTFFYPELSGETGRADGVAGAENIDAEKVSFLPRPRRGRRMINPQPLYRIAHRLHLMGIPKLPSIITRLNLFLTGCDLHFASVVGRRVRFQHYGRGIIVHADCIIKDDVLIMPFVVLGQNVRGGVPVPVERFVIGNGVMLGAGAKVICSGTLEIGDGASIGANAVVLNSIPAGATAVGAPARVVEKAALVLSPPVPRGRGD